MTIVLLLFGLGIILLALEVVVPGAILGIVGGVVMLVGVIVAFDRFGFDGGLIATVVALALVGIALYLEFVLLPKSRLARTFSMTGTVSGQSQPAVADRTVIGRRAIAVTPLSPSGMVEVDGRRYEAFSRNGHANVGAELDIVDLDNFRLIVSQASIHRTT